MQWLKWISEIQAIAQNGLAYSNSEFDKERYEQLMKLVSEMAAYHIDSDEIKIRKTFSLEQGYVTPKIDVRAFIIQNDKLLLVKERSDNLWTLPGGWADVHTSPSEAVLKEVQEETGFTAKTIRLLALWDKLKHDHPPQWPHVYKCFFHCEITGGRAQENLEISQIDFFDFAELPDLSVNRVTKKQILRLREIFLNNESTAFD